MENAEVNTNSQEQAADVTAESFYSNETSTQETKPENQQAEPTEKEAVETKDSEESIKFGEKPDESEAEKVGDKEEKTEDKPDSEEIEYDLSIEESKYLIKEDAQEVLEFAKEHKLSNETAKALLAGRENLITDVLESMQATEQKKIEDWENETKSDQVLGGDNLKETYATAELAFSKIEGGKELIQILNANGLAKNLPVVRFFKNLGDQFKNADLVMDAKPAEGKAAHDILYDYEKN